MAVFFAPNRGYARELKGDWTGAVADYTQAIKLDPRDADTYLHRGGAYLAQGEYARALADFDAVVEIQPNRSAGYSRRAWLLAVCPDKAFRNGKKAVQDAARAAQLAGGKDAAVLNTLAAAHAETGDFDAAVRWQAQAIQILGKNVPVDYRQRLEMYREGKPYRLQPMKKEKK